MLAQSGVRYVIVLESINDIGRLARLQTPWDEITAQQLEMGLKQIADAAHEHGIKAIGATLTPYGGANYYSDKGEAVREAVNPSASAMALPMSWVVALPPRSGVCGPSSSTRSMARMTASRPPRAGPGGRASWDPAQIWPMGLAMPRPAISGGGSVHRFEHGRVHPLRVQIGGGGDGDGAGAGRGQVGAPGNQFVSWTGKRGPGHFFKIARTALENLG